MTFDSDKKYDLFIIRNNRRTCALGKVHYE